MIVCVNLDIADVLYTYAGPMSTSRVDYFIVSQGLGCGVDICNTIDNHLFSDHIPIYVFLLIYNLTILI